MRCEDYPCCGHGPPPMGDGGGCPDSEGRFNCVTCGSKLPKGASSSICIDCQSSGRGLCEGEECPGCDWCMREASCVHCGELECDDDCDCYSCSGGDVDDLEAERDYE